MDGIGDPLYQVWVHQLEGMREQLESKSSQQYGDFLLWLQSERCRLSALLGDIE